MDDVKTWPILRAINGDGQWGDGVPDDTVDMSAGQKCALPSGFDAGHAP